MKGTQRIFKGISEYIAFLGGSVLFGAAINMFLRPGGIVMGGVTGIATALNYKFGLPVGIMMMAINIPLLLGSAKLGGTVGLRRSVMGIVGSSVASDLMTMLPVTLYDPLLCALFGGVVMGVGAGIMITRGYTTGGTDLAAYMLKRKFRRLSTGGLILLLDAVVIVGAAVLMGKYDGIIYSSIAVFAYSVAVDMVLGGAERAKMAFIISDRYTDIADAVQSGLGRGVTVLDGTGWYTKEEKNLLMCIVKPAEEYKLREIVKESDPEAFVILCDASQVLGEGFGKRE